MNPDLTNRTGSIITLIAAALGILGSIGPWLAVGPVTANGTDGNGDGFITLTVMVLAAVLAGVAIGQRRNRFGGVVFLLAITAAGVAIRDLIRIDNATVGAFADVIDPSIGWGLWAVIAASFGIGIGGFLTAYNTEPHRLP